MYHFTGQDLFTTSSSLIHAWDFLLACFFTATKFKVSIIIFLKFVIKYWVSSCSYFMLIYSQKTFLFLCCTGDMTAKEQPPFCCFNSLCILYSNFKFLILLVSHQLHIKCKFLYTVKSYLLTFERI